MERFRKDTMTVVNDIAAFRDAISFLRTQDTLVVDTETSGLDVWRSDYLAGVGVGTVDFQFYFSFRHPDSILSLESVREELASVLHSCHYLCAYNAIFDLTVLFKAGLYNPYLMRPEQEIVDIPAMGRLIFYDQFPDLSLIGAVARLLGLSYNEYDYAFKQWLKSNKLRRIADAPTGQTAIYCMNDVYCESAVYTLLLSIIKERQLESIFTLERQIVPVVWKMEERGVKADLAQCQIMLEQIERRIKEVQPDVGENINVGSVKDLRTLFANLGLKSVIQTDAGQDSWNAEALFFVNHPVADKIRLIRSLNKIKNTYLEEYQREGLLRGTYRSWGTVTGRFTSTIAQTLPRLKIILSEENYKQTNTFVQDVMQANVSSFLAKQHDLAFDDAIPYMRWLTDEAYIEDVHLSAKRPLVARDGFTLFGYDFSQMEIRVLFRYLNNPEVLKLLTDEKWDAHAWVAAKVWKISSTDEQFTYRRNLAKAISFGIVYGEGLDSLATRLDVSKEDAKVFREEYLDMLPGIRSFLASVPRILVSRGYVHNFFGRQYRVSPDASYKLVNYLIQGTSADFIKNRMIAVDKYLQATSSRMLLQIHDELIFEIADTEIATVVPRIKEILEENILGVPLLVTTSKYYPSLAHKSNVILEELK